MYVDTMKVNICGMTPMLMHNGRGANPLDPNSIKMKSLSSKRNKTKDDIEELLLIQWETGLYFNDEIGLYMPSENLYAAFYKAAKKFKLGMKCSAISFPDPIGYPIFTANHTNYIELKKDTTNKFVKTIVIQKAKTISCRPIFNKWEMNFELEFETNIIDANEIKTILMAMSQRVGLGVWTPGSPKPGIFGKFLIKSLEWYNSKAKKSTTISVIND